MSNLLLHIKKFYWGLLSGTPNIWINRVLTKSVEAILKNMESSVVKESAELKHIPIFIIGPPRSGSTLLYQLITLYFKVCYFSNFMVRFPETPACLARLLALLNGCSPPYNFESRFGTTVGWKSPSQGIAIWHRWFPKDNSYVRSSDTSKEILREIRNTILLIQKSFDAPFVNKWQANTVRLFPISEALPEALFIRIKRDPVFIAQSILHGKRTLLQDEHEWFSAKPHNYEELKHKEPLEQVCEQVFYIEEGIDRDSRILGMDKFMTVHYEELCKLPRKVMDDINKFYMKNQKFGYLKPSREIPSSFHCNLSIQVSPEEFKFMETYFSQKKI